MVIFSIPCSVSWTAGDRTGGGFDVPDLADSPTFPRGSHAHLAERLSHVDGAHSPDDQLMLGVENLLRLRYLFALQFGCPPIESTWQRTARGPRSREPKF